MSLNITYLNLTLGVPLTDLHSICLHTGFKCVALSHLIIHRISIHWNRLMA